MVVRRTASVVSRNMGHPVVYRDTSGGYFDPIRPRESHLVVLREVSPSVA